MFEIPGLTVAISVLEVASAQYEKPVRRNKQIKPRLDELERKVGINAGVMITSSDNLHQCIRKIAYCMADAVGLSVDISSLAV